MRTVIQVIESIDLPTNWKQSITEQDVKETLQAEIIGQKLAMGQYPLQDNEFNNIVNEAFEKLKKDTDRYNYYALVSFSHKCDWNITPEFFIESVNRLIKHYMFFFKDHFVHEITIDTPAESESLRGIMCLVCDQDGFILDRKHRIGKIPAIMRTTWIQRPEEKINDFKSIIQRKELGNPVVLLLVRANHFLIIGAYRSAIIEASVALEISITRKIWNGLKSQGKSEAEIQDILKGKKLDFAEKAKKILKLATGVSAAQFDNPLWERVCTNREKFRNKIAHSDKEPTNDEAKAIVSDIETLTNYIENIFIS